MKVNFIKYLIRHITSMGERCLELIAFVRYRLYPRREGKENINEIYSIREECANEEYVIEFLKARIKAAAINRYKVTIEHTFSSPQEEEIGRVTLTCSDRYIEHATLIAGQHTTKENRLIYWKFN